MDNVTHTLAGLLLAESAIQLRGRESASPAPSSTRFATFAVVSSAIAANLPDSDLLYTGFGSDRLIYLLHHRGYTHTVLIALLMGVLLWACVMMLWRPRKEGPARGDARWLLALLIVSMMSHLALDWTNSYGVHLFWPFDDRWQYGDSVFIIEPWLWVVSIPALVMASPRRLSRALLSLALVAILVVAWRIELVSRGTAIALTLGSLAAIALARAMNRRRRAVVAVAGWLAVTAAMAAGASTARAATLGALNHAGDSAEVLDVIVTPTPANPICASVITLERAGGLYRLTTARVSALPAITAAANCVSRDATDGSFAKSAKASSDAVHWDREWSAPVGELATLAAHSCDTATSLHFMRAPVWSVTGGVVTIGDARFGTGKGSDFSDISSPVSSECTYPTPPPWRPPREDLLGLRRSPR
jgi:inner membrane protein